LAHQVVGRTLSSVQSQARLGLVELADQGRKWGLRSSDLGAALAADQARRNCSHMG
jgi:hypothetical protein